MLRHEKCLSIEHAIQHGSTPVTMFIAWFALRVKKWSIEEAMEYCMSIMVAHHVMNYHVCSLRYTLRDEKKFIIEHA
jgi:hypothetical protein